MPKAAKEKAPKKEKATKEKKEKDPNAPKKNMGESIDCALQP